MSVLSNFGDWKNFLNERVEQAQSLGMDKDTITDVAYQIGDYLAKEIDPKNEQERLLKELWDAADEEEQRTMASLMVKLVHGGQQ
ncbi:DUF3243 domain-containing protein [Melghirimyces algeriensis]|uniref:DUF3243 domain-containing protein n=1 Tax=Melghirimyces algeriensis TaxID=910412 RepID=A0A521C836_9BACL|nr:DUF3243 domain-containing protein [Melghirimyces algeriensis]SMO55599.1 Protein of unknown function [Melghirimyces algeriensis]